MLIEFSVKNYRSIKDEQTLSLAKAKSGELAETNTFNFSTAAGMELLTTAAIYGPNASGKTSKPATCPGAMGRCLTCEPSTPGKETEWVRITLSVFTFRLLLHCSGLRSALIPADGL